MRYILMYATELFYTCVGIKKFSLCSQKFVDFCYFLQ